MAKRRKGKIWAQEGEQFLELWVPSLINLISHQYVKQINDTWSLILQMQLIILLHLDYFP